jgi:hypothetical protein
MSECLHCDIMELVDQQLAEPNADLVEVAAKVAEAMTDVVLMAEPQDQAKLMAEVITLIGSLYLEKSGATDGGGTEPGSSGRRH